MVRDPVCGMTIAEQDASATRHIGGTQVYFCSAACVAQFDAEPQRYYPPLGGASVAPTAAIAIPTASQVGTPAPTIKSEALLRPVTLGLLAVLGLLAFYL